MSVTVADVTRQEAMQTVAVKAIAWPGARLLVLAPCWADLVAAMGLLWRAPGFTSAAEPSTTWSPGRGFGKHNVVRLANGSTIRFVSATAGTPALCGAAVDEAVVVGDVDPGPVREVARRAKACWGVT
jgi:hypothetical protein